MKPHPLLRKILSSDDMLEEAGSEDEGPVLNLLCSRGLFYHLLRLKVLSYWTLSKLKPVGKTP